MTVAAVGEGQAADSRLRRLLLLTAGSALVVGLVVRFLGLGSAPLAVDEYYFGMSVLNILERGLPEFAGGGYYTRGILIQYLTLPLIQSGMSLEYAVRLWPAVASCLTIFGVWRISRLIGGISHAALATILVTLSIWEIEFARFGRMYAPFQAFFVWYVYFQIRHLIHGREGAKWWAMLISALSIFTYAGASFLLILNFLPLVWRGRGWSVPYLAGAVVLLVAGVKFYSIDLRYSGVPAEALPPTDASAANPSLPVSFPVLPDIWVPLLIVGICASVFLVWWFRRSLFIAHPAALYWLLAAVACGFGLFAFAAGLVVAGLLLGLPLARSAGQVPRAVAAAILVSILAIWSVVLVGSHLAADLTPGLSMRKAAQYAFDYPDVYYRIVRPWLVTIPATTVALAALVTPVVWQELRSRLRKPDVVPSGLGYLAGALILLAMLSAIFRQPYMITRYTYFLYPLVLILAGAGILALTKRVRGDRLRPLVPFSVLLVLFLVTEDYSIAHMARINEPAYRYRTAYDDRLAAHYYARWDFRSPAEYVNMRVEPGDRVIVFDEPLLYYLDRADGIYIRAGTEIHKLTWASNGTRHLWSNAPLLDTESEVSRLVETAPGAVWLITRTEAVKWLDPLERALVHKYSLKPKFLSQDGHLAVYVIGR